MTTRNHILVADDNATNVTVLVKSLEKKGYTTSVAMDGVQAVDLAVEQHPDLILLDVMMPERDGYEVCQILKSRDETASIPIIFLTTRAATQDVITAFSMGACDFVTKPFRVDELLSRVEVHVQLASDQKKLARKNDQLQEMSRIVAESNLELAEQARIDPLTKLLNRRAWEEAMLLEQSRSDRHDEAYGIVMIDVDHFKAFNDSQGHQSGDRCLQQVAQCIQSTCRPTDMAARYGGEEFVILAARTDLGGAVALAERVRTGIEKLNISHPTSLVSDRVTVSLGIAMERGGSWEDVLKEADDALYAAKKNGRNLVWSDAVQPPVEECSPATTLVGSDAKRPQGLPDGRQTILIVEDDPTSRALLRGCCKREGFYTVEAEDGQCALDTVSKQHPDIILMDVMMPRVDGLECTRRLKSNPETKAIPIIIVTAKAAASDITAGLKAGADEYLIKPIRTGEIALRLRTMAERKRERDELRRNYISRGEQARILGLLLGLAQRLGDASDLDDAIQETIQTAADVTRCRRISIMLPNTAHESLHIAGAKGIAENVITDTAVPIGESIAGRVFESHKPIVVNSEKEASAYQESYDSSNFASFPLACTTLGSPTRVVGVLNVTERVGGHAFDQRELDFIDLIGNIAGTAIDNLLTRVTRDEARDSIMLAFAKLAEHRDSDTGQHVDRVTRYSLILAEELRKLDRFASEINDVFMYDLRRATPLHDIGKVAIPDSILLKPGRLTPHEMDIMRTHAEIGAQTIQSVRDKAPSFGILQMAQEIAHFHHEWYDGTGYPRRLKGEAIPLSCRIIGLVDVYDAVTTKRVYKDAICHDEAVTIILKSSGTQFDPEIVEAFLGCESEFKRLSTELADPLDIPSDSPNADADMQNKTLMGASAPDSK